MKEWMPLLGQSGPPVIFSGVLGTSLATFPDFSKKPGTRVKLEFLTLKFPTKRKTSLLKCMEQGIYLSQIVMITLKVSFFWGKGVAASSTPSHPAFPALIRDWS